MTDRTDRGDAATENDDAGAEATEATKREGHLVSDRGRKKEIDDAYLDRGALVGRYVVLERIGEGGMGVVYGAYDPELDRKVAIKLLQARDGGSESGGAQAWLLREAQALARLQHPNVVAVHDVGTLPGDRVFIAMELVEGKTLRKWLKGEQRSWREVVSVLVAAGQGLVAAHAAGLVHRDFKPDNVLVGNDGRVRVMDFGLARLRPGQTGDTGPVPRSSDLHIEAKSPLTDSLTLVGSVIGTPAYMAPEIYDGTPADASTDQFALGVTTFESLFRARPFSKEELQPPRATVPKPKIPEATKVPARIQRAVLRMLAIDPAQRFASIEAALAELQVDPFANRKRALVGGGLVALAGGAFALSMVMRSSGPAPCTGIEQQLAGVWDVSVKKQVHDGFLATKRPHAAAAFESLDRALDGYTAAWAKTAIESCRATRVAKNQTDDVLSLRQTCLDQRRDELGALTKLLADPGVSLVEKADKVVFELEPIETCNNVALLRAPGRPPPELKAKLAEVHKVLADAKAQVIAGRYFPAMVSSQKSLDQARAIGYEPVIAEALVVRGIALTSTGNFQDGATTQMEAAWSAIAANRDDIATSAALAAAMMVSDAFGKPGEGKIWAHLAAVYAKRAGLDHVLEGRIATVNGVIAAQSGDNATAIAEHEKAYEAAIRREGRDSPALWSDELMLATTEVKALAYQRAAAHFEHAMALRAKIVGADHLDVALILSNIGICYRHLGQFDKARAAYEKTIAVREKLFGKANPLLVAPLVNYADLLKDTGEVDKALIVIDRAMKLLVPLPGSEHPSYHEAASTHAQVLAAAGRIKEARAELDEIIAIEQRVKSAVLPTTQTARAELELADQQYGDAATFAEQAIAGFEAASGVENPELWRPLTRLAQAKLALGDPAAARPLLERAIAIGTKSGMGEFDLKETRALLAGLP